jgi:adenylate cyclase
MSEARKLAAVLVADVVGYSRRAAADESRTLAHLRGLRSDLMDPATALIMAAAKNASFPEKTPR